MGYLGAVLCLAVYLGLLAGPAQPAGSAASSTAIVPLLIAAAADAGRNRCGAAGHGGRLWRTDGAARSTVSSISTQRAETALEHSGSGDEFALLLKRDARQRLHDIHPERLFPPPDGAQPPELWALSRRSRQWQSSRPRWSGYAGGLRLHRPPVGKRANGVAGSKPDLREDPWTSAENPEARSGGHDRVPAPARRTVASGREDATRRLMPKASVRRPRRPYRGRRRAHAPAPESTNETPASLDEILAELFRSGTIETVPPGETEGSTSASWRARHPNTCPRPTAGRAEDWRQPAGLPSTWPIVGADPEALSRVLDELFARQEIPLHLRKYIRDYFLAVGRMR